MALRTPKSLFSAVLALTMMLVPSSAWAAPDAFTQALNQGPLYAALAALVGGFLVSLTPCVYPMIAITVSVFGARQAEGRWSGAALSGAFVLGIVAMFVPLGVLAGLSGSVFGSVLQSRPVILGISALFLLMAAAMFGAFELALPAFITNRLASIGGLGYKGAFFLGLACGLIASPCTGPVLTGILTFIAQTRSAFLGAAAMAAFAVGLGAPFFVVGTFAVQLPKSGHWMVHVKSILGIVLVVVAFYYLSTTFPALTSWIEPGTLFYALLVVGLVAGLALGAVHRDFAEIGASVKVAKGAGIVLVSLSAFGLLSGWIKPERTFAWQTGAVVEARSLARTEQRPLLVDFTAAWCGACKELERNTFSADAVAREMTRFVAVKVDATDDEDPAVARTLSDFGVVGLPTVLVFDSRGRETLRFTDFVGPDRFLEAIQAVD